MALTSLPSKDYWIKRSEQNLLVQEQKAEEYNSKLLKAYDNAKIGIEKELAVFYQKYAINNDMSYAEAQRLLSKSELDKFKDSLDEYIKAAKLYSNDPEYIKNLESMSIRARVRRIEALKLNIQHEIEMLSSEHESNTSTLLSDNYSDNYYRSIWTVQTGFKFGLNFDKLNQAAIDKTIKIKWLDENYSDRIYNDKAKLIQTLGTELTQSFIRGDSGQNTAKRLYRRLDISYNNATRLVRTESNHISNEAQAEGYIASGIVSEYEYLATLDLLTSHICQDLDGKIFKLSERQVGVNYPPALPNCRSTTIPHFPDEVTPERIAKGKTYSVNGDMTYKDWYEKYVNKSSKSEKSDIINDNTFKGFIPDLSNVATEGLIASHNNVLKYGLKIGNERLSTIYKSNGKKAFNYLDGTNNQVIFTKELSEFLENAPKGSLISTHNHPSSSAFSDADLNVLHKFSSIDSITVQGHDGTKYMCRIGSGTRLKWTDLRKNYQSLKDRYFEFFQEKVRQDNNFIEDAWKEHSNAILSELADQYNWEYKRIVTDEYADRAEKYEKEFKEWLRKQK